MVYFKRKIDKFLADWKNNHSRKPLIVKGARQIGKTESILHFAHENYENVVYINFVLDKKYTTIVNDGYDVETVVKNITLINPSTKFIPDKTLIVFDEIQEYPDIATSLKAFNLDKRYDVICSGSMLGINYRKIHSNSVGSKTDYEMFSMDFEEFLWAKGYEDTAINSILEHMISLTPFSETELSVYKSLFLDYCVLGGMPDVIKGYIKTGTFSQSLEIQGQIRLENKKFQFSIIDKKARSREYTGCIEWLIDAGVVTECNCLNYPELPLKGNVDNSKYKLYYPDTGLLISALDEEAQEDLRVNKNLGVYKGALYENFVAEAFVKQGLGLFYYKKDNSTLEEDFFVRSKNELIPVEVKSNNDSSKSLTALIKSDRYADIKHGIKLGDFNVGVANNIYTFPYFCAFMLKAYLQKWD